MSDAIPSIDDPREVYEDRLKIRRRVAAIRRRTEGRISMVRLVLFLLAAGLAWPALFTDIMAWGWIFVPVAAFVAVVLWHARVIRLRELDERAAGFYERGLERLADRWAGRGNAGQSYLHANHAYAADLDIFGRGSLFELICAARTRPGEAMLARWLSSPAPPATVRERQAAVEELRPRLDLREQLALVGEDVRAELDPDDLTQWASGEPLLTERWPAIVAAALGVVNLVTLLASLTVSGVFPVFLASAVVSGAFALVFRRRVVRVLIQVDRPEHELELLGAILAGLESESFQSPLLSELRANLDTRGLPPSRRIAALARLVQINDSRRNMFFAPLAALTFSGTHLAFAVERWRRQYGDGIERWLDAVGAIEALSSLAGYAFEHPTDPMPEVVDDAPLFDGRAIGHPLLSEAACVRNDVRLGDGLQLLLVSGSNMSGKSTLLRTVGVNVVLALAGGPVRARELRVSPLAVGASMRVTDSLQEGLSHFYAEIKRLSVIVEIGEGSPPLLFLLDEILHGTNSHDRRIGAEALIRNLVDQGSIGMVTTHDLALAKIAEDLEPRAANVHFEDQLERDRVVFDYTLRPGVVRKGNALELMRSIGLKV
jgi:hypothetical protein